MRWPPLNPQTKKQKKKQKTDKKRKQTQKYQKRAFQLSVIFSFLVGVQNFPFWTTWHKTRAPQNTIKNRGFREHILKNSYASRNGHFWTQKTQIQKFQLSFVLSFFFSFNRKKNTTMPWNPYFYSVLAKSKRDLFLSTNHLKTQKLEKPNFAPFFKAIFRNLLDNWPKNKNTKW